MSQILCNLRYSGKFMTHVLSEKARRHEISRLYKEICVLQCCI